jgi:hypothetical protein
MIELEDYVECAKETESVVDDVDGINSRLLHGAIGLATEAGELLDSIKKSIFYHEDYDFVNLREEIGDCMWYLAVLCDELGLDFYNMATDRTFQPPLKATCANDLIHSMFELYYDTSVLAQAVVDSDIGVDESTICQAVASIFYPLNDLVYLSGSRWNIIADKNIRKLAKRFPKKFSKYKALNRDLDTERKELEG